MPDRVRDLPPDERPFTRCGYACRYTLPDFRPVAAADADNSNLSITVAAQSPARHERFHATIPAADFRAMDDEHFMRTVAEWAHQVQHGGPISETDPCRQAHAFGPQETCVLRKGHGWWHRSANGAEWKAEDGPTWTLPWPKDHRLHPANEMRCAPEETVDA